MVYSVQLQWLHHTSGRSAVTKTENSNKKKKIKKCKYLWQSRNISTIAYHLNSAASFPICPSILLQNSSTSHNNNDDIINYWIEEASKIFIIASKIFLLLVNGSLQKDLLCLLP